MEFFNYLMNRIEDGCEFRRVGGKPISINVDGSLVTEVKYGGEIYRVFVQKDRTNEGRL